MLNKIIKCSLLKPLMAFCLAMFINLVHSQDLEPGFMSSLPIKGNIGIASYGFSQGEILLDNTLPIEDLESKMHSLAFGYVRSFKLFNRLTKFDVVVPYALADFNALVEDEEKSLSKNGFGDPLLRLSIILIGGKPLVASQFFKEKQKNFKLGVAFRIKVPLGQYNPEDLINLGGNRWAIKTNIAGSYTIKEKLVFEGRLSSWFFQDNNDFFGGQKTQQKPLFGAQFHTTYIFKPGIWLAASIGGVKGGETSVNGEKAPSQKNNRYGLAFAYRLSKRSSLKAAYTNGFVTRVGSDFNTVLLAYQFIWFDKK